jgi:predicted nucleic acid-binding Zn ribbon protein
MRCVCGHEFEAKTVRRQFCSDKCRKASRQAKRAHTLARLEENLTHALAQAIRERTPRPGPVPAEGRSGSWSRHQTADE